MICPKRLAELINIHMSTYKVKEPCWEIGVSRIAGRGVFANRKIKAGEVIFREDPLLIGPAMRTDAPLNVCSICYKGLDAKKFLCKQGCGLPLCEMCSRKKQHKAECQQFKSWEPNDPSTANPDVIRFLTIARGLFLNKHQKDLLYCMQSNTDAKLRSEVNNAANLFKKFPAEKKVLEYMYRIVAVLNTNAFDASTSKENSEYALRALYPLAGTLNHECTPNTTYSFDDKNNSIVVKATRDLPEGAEFTVSYTKLLWSNLMRQLYLKMTKQFTCRCARCNDPTENGAMLSALYCKQDNCSGLVLPENTSTLQPAWKCMECKKQYKHSEMSKSQDFALGAINAKLGGDTVKPIIEFLNTKVPGFCPESNHIVVEAKMAVISRMNRSKKEQFTFDDCQDKNRYCDEVMAILDKLGMGDCGLRTFLIEERRK